MEAFRQLAKSGGLTWTERYKYGLALNVDLSCWESSLLVTVPLNFHHREHPLLFTVVDQVASSVPSDSFTLVTAPNSMASCWVLRPVPCPPDPT